MRILILLLLATQSLLATDFKPITLRPDYRHDRFITQPKEIVREFESFIVSFDWIEDDGQAWGIPDFVAYEIKRLDKEIGKAPRRPRPWITDKELYRKGIAPSDATYHHSPAFLSANKDWYVRGHLCMKDHAWRLGADADWNTHTVLNAVPQRGSFNSGIWLDLENKTAEWADKYGAVWIITGPIVNGSRPNAFLGEKNKGEMLIAIPDALFKIVIRDAADGSWPEVLAFWYPQQHEKYSQKPYDHRHFLVSVNEIEAVTRLDFLTDLPDDIEEEIESNKAVALWD